MRLKQGEVFNRSSLTADVEDLERYYTDRGFFYASVSPRTELKEDQTVDVTFDVQKGELHFIREIDVIGQHAARATRWCAARCGSSRASSTRRAR